MGGSGAGSGGSFTPDAAFACDELAIAAPDAPRSAIVPEAAIAAVAGVPAVGALAGFAAEAPVAIAAVAAGARAPGSAAAAGMLALIGTAEMVWDGKGGLDGTPVDEALRAGAAGGGICDSRTVLTLVTRFASA
ncbi:hypothetical protein AYM40_02995 [Paraburkholderia phytofirmans OLGA172]|uniref:Uncharacterized protein n=1 Tax=Paraburkholderia phytofirmans OLGA172 TaxID=1417228 RepID=A0A160FH47_9BURK|nr:hypothetical protein AYM40_02995 [Paraburkholderia phytofirmans OLGA172]